MSFFISYCMIASIVSQTNILKSWIYYLGFDKKTGAHGMGCVSHRNLLFRIASNFIFLFFFSL